MSRGVASSLALLASIMILTTQICINLAFTEIVNEEVMRRVKEIVEGDLKGLSLVAAINDSSLVIVNGRERELSVIGLSLYNVDGRVVDIEVNWNIPKGSVATYQVPEALATCIAVKLTFKEGGEVLLPLSRV